MEIFISKKYKEKLIRRIFKLELRINIFYFFIETYYFKF